MFTEYLVKSDLEDFSHSRIQESIKRHLAYLIIIVSEI